MTWTILDDGFPFHRKVLAAGNEAVGAFVRMLSWSNKEGTDGFISDGTVGIFASPDVVERLVANGLLHRVEGGFTIHDFHDYQPEAADEKRRRERLHEAKSMAGRKGMAKRWSRKAAESKTASADNRIDNTTCNTQGNRTDNRAITDARQEPSHRVGDLAETGCVTPDDVGATITERLIFKPNGASVIGPVIGPVTGLLYQTDNKTITPLPLPLREETISSTNLLPTSPSAQSVPGGPDNEDDFPKSWGSGPEPRVANPQPSAEACPRSDDNLSSATPAAPPTSKARSGATQAGSLFGGPESVVQVKAAKRAAKASKPPEPEVPGYKAVIDAYFVAYERAKGAKPVFTTRNGKAAKTLLALMTETEVLAVISRAFSDSWFLKTSGELWAIAAEPNKWRGSAPTLIQRRAGQILQPADPSAPWLQDGYGEPNYDDYEDDREAS